LATYVFLNVPAHGHVNPTLAVAQELVRRGERVIYYLSEDFRAAIEAMGATFRGYASESQMAHVQLQGNVTPGSMPASPLPLMMVNESAGVLPQVIERIRADQPNYILYDTMCLWAKIAARALRVPAILFLPTYASNSQFNLGRMMGAGISEHSSAMSTNPAAGVLMGPAQDSTKNAGASSTAANGPAMNVSAFFSAFRQVDGRLAELCRAYGVEPFPAQEMFQGSEMLNIVFLPKEFQPRGETFDEQRFVFVGPSIQPRLDESHFPFEQLTGRTTLYISLGTVFNNQAAFYNMCFAALKDEPWQVVLSTGRRLDPTILDPIPANFLVRPQVPQLEVLQQTSLFVTHCGMNSTMESLYYGVPMVGVPQMAEQMVTARRIQEFGLGTALDKNTLTVEQLHATIKAVLSNADTRTNVQAMQKHVRNAGGYRRAADAIMNFAQSQRQATTQA
jgi:MGT family glycosyltransferase